MAAPPAVRLEPIGPENEAVAAALTVRTDQAGFIATNAASIEETRGLAWPRLFGVYAGEEMVGFLVYGRDPDDGNCWLYRFMIDHRHQGKGIGRAALRLLIDRLRAEAECPSLTIGYQPDNIAAERLYHSEGFEPAGVAAWGEKLVRRRIEPAG